MGLPSRRRPQAPICGEPCLISARVPGDLHRADERGFGLLFPTELVQQDAPTGVRRRKVGAPLEHLVVDGKRLVVTPRVHEERGEAEAQPKMLGMVGEPCPVRGLSPSPVPDGVTGQRQRLPGLGVARIDLHAPRQGPQGILRLAPAQQAGPQHPVGVSVARGEVPCAKVGTQRQVVAPLELVGETHLDDWARVRGAKRREPREGTAGLRGRVGHQARSGQLEPADSVARIGLSGRLETPNGLIEVAVNHRAPPYPHIPRGAGRQQRQEQRQCLTGPPRPETIAPMDRSTLTRILEEADGITSSGSVFEPSEGHRLSFYLGEPGRAMVLGEVRAVHLHQGYVQLDRKPTDGSLFFDYEAIHGLALRPPDEISGRRPGF